MALATVESLASETRPDLSCLSCVIVCLSIPISSAISRMVESFSLKTSRSSLKLLLAVSGGAVSVTTGVIFSASISFKRKSSIDILKNLDISHYKLNLGSVLPSS